MDEKMYGLFEVFGLEPDGARAQHDEAMLRIVEFCEDIQSVPPIAFSSMVHDFYHGTSYDGLSPRGTVEKKAMRMMLMRLLVNLFDPASALKRAADDCADLLPKVHVPEYARNPEAPTLESLNNALLSIAKDSAIDESDIDACAAGFNTGERDADN